ncbi:hypothetical protein HF072_11340 [Bacillus sp. RO3]|nr:hypothetical protein [Bacillus sp. RO3]
MDSYKLNKPLNISLNVFLLSFIIGAWILLFDDEPKNDSVGWMSLMVFWTGKGMYDMVMNLKNGSKKTAMIDLLLAVVALGVLIWTAVSYWG